MCSNPLLSIYCIRLHKIIVILRCEQGQCDDMCARLGQCVTSHTSINYFKSLLQKTRFAARKKDDAKRSEDETVCLCFA